MLAYVNHANMGVYRDAVRNALAANTTPDIITHPFRTTVKYGFGVNLEHSFGHGLRGFGRWGWKEGQHESYAYTEVDETAAAGADLAGAPWRRKNDKLGAAFVSNGIAADHQQYLKLGGRGLLLGDGGLTYGRENLLESYYTAHVWRGLFVGPTSNTSAIQATTATAARWWRQDFGSIWSIEAFHKNMELPRPRRRILRVC